MQLIPAGQPPQVNTARWALNPPSNGEYNIYARWSAHANRASNATYSVDHANGLTTVSVNQRQNGGQWQLLGTFPLDPNTSHSVTLTDQADGYVIADPLAYAAINAPPSDNRATWVPELRGRARIVVLRYHPKLYY